MAYLILSHPPGQPEQAFAAMVGDLVAQATWSLAFEAYGLAVLVGGERPPPVQPLLGRQGVGGVLVGQVFDRAATDRGAVAIAGTRGLADLDPLEACQVLVERTWGDYVAVLVPHRARPPVALCAPMGALPAFLWRRDEITLVGSAVPDGLAAPLGLAIDWTRLADILAEPPRAGGPPPLDGLQWIAPGSCRHGPDGAASTTLWSPAKVLRAARPRRALAPGTDEARLRAAVDASVAALAADAGPILCEISGGLDSAIVATSLAALGHRPARAANFYRHQAEGDERAYAQAVADRIGAPLTTLARDLLVLKAETFAFSARSAQPNFNAVDIDYDRLLSREIAKSGAQVMFTGHGGDVVFYQIGAAELAADLLGGAPCEGRRLERLGDIARRTRRSVWSLAWQALRGRPGQGSPEQMAIRTPVILARALGPGHPWMQDLGGISPAKRLQIGGLVLSQRVFAETLRGEQVRLAHPLLSQPVVELCLEIPAPRLSSGEAERSLARRAFGDRLPDSIVQRRSKGDISVFFGRSLAASVPFLRSFLLQGRLMARGLLDPEALDAMLAPEALIWRDAYGQIMAAATLEAWVRHWEGRIATGLAAAPASGGGDGAAKASSRKAKARK